MGRFFNSSFLKRISALTVAAALFMSLSSCGRKPSAVELMSRFCEEYGVFYEILSPSFSEGEKGHVGEDFFESVFLESPNSVSDYAIVFLSSLDFIGECAVFVCYSDYDAILTVEMLWRRVDLLKSSAVGIGGASLSDAVVFKRGKYAVMCALSNNALAERIWRRIL